MGNTYKRLASKSFSFLFAILVLTFLWKGYSITYYKITFPLIGLFSIIHGIASIIIRKKDIQHSKVFKGTVIDLIQEWIGDGYTYHPLIEYYEEN